MEANLRFVGPGDDGDQDLRPPLGLAELDLPAPQRRRPEGALRRFGTGARPDVRPQRGCDRHDRRRHRRHDPQQRRPRRRPPAAAALESWQPKFIEWWKRLGPVAFQDNDVYLRTAIDVGQEGWANFDYVKMPDYRWGIFLADPSPIGASPSATTSASRSGRRSRASTAPTCAA